MPKFLGEIVQNGGDFALLDSSNVRGGFMQVSTIVERDSIIPDKLKLGMLAHVEDTGKLYKYTKYGWVEYDFKFNSGEQPVVHTLSALVIDVKEQDGSTLIKTDLAFEVGDILGYNITSSLDGEFFTILSKQEDYYEISGKVPINQYIQLVGSLSNKDKQLVCIFHVDNGTTVLS